MLKAANITMDDLLMEEMKRLGYDLQAPFGSDAWLKKPVFIQSFEQVCRDVEGAGGGGGCCLLGSLRGGWGLTSSVHLRGKAVDERALVCSWGKAD